MGLEIWEERNGESESSSHRDESGSFLLGEEFAWPRTRFDIETDGHEKKRDIEGWRSETKIIKRYFILDMVRE